MASSSVSASSRSQRTRSTKLTAVSTRTRRSSAYDDDFEQHLLDNGVFPEGYEHPDGRSTPEPTNLDSVHQTLLLARASLSPSRFSESAFRDFKRKNKTKSEGTVMRSLVPIIAGTADIPNEGHLPFTNLESLTNETTVKAVPDFFDGAHPETINKDVSKVISQMIIPTKHSGVPAAPNFFLEAKARKGGADVAERQACLDGAYGARALHALRSYAEGESAHDGNARAYSSTFHDGTLKLFAHHMTQPSTGTGRSQYHMTQLRSFGMTDSRATFIAGATAFRNARDLAKLDRDSSIRAANARAEEGKRTAEDDFTETSTEDEFPTSSINQEDSAAWKNAHDALQQQLAGDSQVHDLDDSKPQCEISHSDTDRDSQTSSQELAAPDHDDPSASFVSSFTSTLSGGTMLSKRHRPSLSVDSSPQERRPSKIRSRSDADP